MSSPDFRDRKYMAFTKSNVLSAVWNVKTSYNLMLLLFVPIISDKEYERKYGKQLSEESTRSDALNKYVTLFMDLDPEASWRSVNTALDGIGEKEMADSIRHLAEPITDSTLNIQNLCQVTASVKYSRSSMERINFYLRLGIPFGALEEIGKAADSHETEEAILFEAELKAFLLYFLQNVPMASWERVAGALFSMKETKALEEVKKFLKHTPEPSLTPENLSLVLSHLPDLKSWRKFAEVANMPDSLLNRMDEFATNKNEWKYALVHLLISEHPAPSWALVARALYRTQFHTRKALDFLQQHFPTGRFRSKLIYQQEMERGFVELDLDKVLLFGVAGSGKTSVLSVLLGEDPSRIRCSTPLLKRPIEVLLMDVDGFKRWKIRLPSELRDAVAEIIHSRMPQEELGADPSSASPDAPIQKSLPATVSPAPEPAPEGTVSSLQSSRRSSSSSASGTSSDWSEGEIDYESEEESEEPRPKPSLDAVLASSKVDDEFVSLINTGPPSQEPILRMRQVLVLDSGGQLELLEMMPVFLKGASKFVYVMKAHESLDERPMIRYFKEGQLVWEFPASLSNEGILRLCTRTMSSLNNKNPNIPPAKLMFVATHRDLVPDDQLPGVLDQLHKRLREIVLPRFREQLIFCGTKGEDFIFTMTAADPEKKDRDIAEVIRECLSEIGEGVKVVRVPFRWHALYQKLLEVVSVQERKILSQDECLKVAASMEIDEESCAEALKFFDGLNLLFHFHDILPGLVFMEPQMLLDKVSELVEEMYHMRRGKEGQVMHGEMLKFRDCGQVTEKFLATFESHYEPPIFTAKELVVLLEGLLVFTALSEEVYLMPCLLQAVDWDEVKKHRVCGEKALAVHFPESGPLMGLFCTTVAYLLSAENLHPCPWKVAQDEKGTPECLHRNVIEFSVPGHPGSVTLLDHSSHFELHLHTHPKREHELWQLAWNAVLDGLERAAETIGYTRNTPVPAMICPSHPAKPHPATVSDGVWTCSVHCGVFGDVAEAAIPWTCVFTSDATASATSTPSNATLLDFDDHFEIIDEVHDLAARWKEFGAALRLPVAVLNRIKANNPGDVEKSLSDVVNEWLSQSYNTERFGLPSWKMLVDAVAHRSGGNNYALARQIAIQHNVPQPPAPK